ncbi:MAG: hypothetical protein LBQ88_02180 [Treponema sp.]|nr:hypothetical protein [Treponema sp.]
MGDTLTATVTDTTEVPVRYDWWGDFGTYETNIASTNVTNTWTVPNDDPAIIGVPVKVYAYFDDESYCESEWTPAIVAQ